MDKDYDTFYILLLLFFGILVLSSATILIMNPEITGNIVAIGGNVTRADITAYVQAVHWIGLQGNLTDNPSIGMNLTFSGGDVSHIFLHADDPETVTTILASTGTEIMNSLLSPAGHSDINSYLGIDTTHPTSSEKTFTLTRNFTINSTTYTILTARTNSYLGDYYTGALIHGSDLVFVTEPEYGRGFSNTTVDFQFILPVSGSVTYTFFTGFTAIPPSSLNMTQRFHASSTLNTTDNSIVLEWDEVIGAAVYTIFYIDDPLPGTLDFTGAKWWTTASTAFTDTSFNTTRRYYRIYANDSTSWREAEHMIGATNISLIMLPGSEYNLATFNYEFSNSTLTEVLMPIAGSYSRAYEFDNTLKMYNLYIQGVWDTIHTIKEDFGYWIRVNPNASLITTGRVKTQMNHTLTPDYNLVGFPLILGDISVTEVLSQIHGKYNRVYEFDNVNKAYRIMLPGVWDDIGTIKLNHGYYIRVTEEVTYTR